MPKTKYRVGIIGCGGIGASYATAFQQLHDRVEVVAACDILEEKVNALVDQFEIPVGVYGHATDVSQRRA